MGIDQKKGPNMGWFGVLCIVQKIKSEEKYKKNKTYLNVKNNFYFIYKIITKV